MTERRITGVGVPNLYIYRYNRRMKVIERIKYFITGNFPERILHESKNVFFLGVHKPPVHRRMYYATTKFLRVHWAFTIATTLTLISIALTVF